MKHRHLFGLSLSLAVLLSFATIGHAGIEFISQIPVRTISVDGDPSDWAGIDPWITDPQGDSSCEEGTDFKAVYLARDTTYVYWRMDTWDGKFSSGDSDLFKHPMIHFYAVESGTSPVGVKWQRMRYPDAYGYGVVMVKNVPGGEWVHIYRGVEYGVIGSVAEGKIPLSMLDPFKINNVMVFYYSGYPNVACDVAGRTYTPPPPLPPCPSDMPAPMLKTTMVRVRSTPDGKTSTLLGARLTGPSPDNLSSFTVRSPSGVSTFKLSAASSSLQYGLVYTTPIPHPAEQGNYTFEATDCQGRKDTMVKYFTPKTPLPRVSQSSMSPADKEYVGYGSNLRLSFDGVSGSDVYYQVILRDYSGSIVDLYISPPSKDTFVEIPASLLQPNSPYRWMVRTLDNAADPTVMAETAWCSFFTALKGAPSIRGLIFSHDAPTKSTDFNVNNVTVAPWDIKEIKVSTTGVTQYKEYALGNQPITFLNQPARYGRNVTSPFPSENGYYTFEIENVQGNKAFDTLYFQYNKMPSVPEESRVPGDYAYLTTTTPDFDWDPIQGDGTVYYNVMIRDYSSQLIWHGYPQKSINTEYRVQEKDSFPTGCSFKWVINTFDKDLPERALNIAYTPLRLFTINPSLRGRVKDKETGAFLYNAVVEAKLGNEHHLTKTNADGYYEFTDLAVGEYKIEVTMDRYNKEEIVLDLVSNKTFDQHFTLEPKKEKKDKAK